MPSPVKVTVKVDRDLTNFYTSTVKKELMTAIAITASEIENAVKDPGSPTVAPKRTGILRSSYFTRLVPSQMLA